jgi:hypothetical protein
MDYRMVASPYCDEWEDSLEAAARKFPIQLDYEEILEADLFESMGSGAAGRDFRILWLITSPPPAEVPGSRTLHIAF